MIKKILIFFILVANLYSIERVGSSSAVFLKIPISARFSALGEASTGIGNDLYSIYDNVAGIAKITSMQLGFSHIEWISDTDYEFIGFVKPLNKAVFNYFPTIGFAISYLHLPFFKSYDSWGEVIGEVNFSDFAFSSVYAQKLKEFKSGELFSGLNLKIINETLNDKNDTALTVTLGFLYSLKMPAFTIFRKRIEEQPLNIGFVIENYSLGTKIAGSSTPVVYKLGFSFMPFKFILYNLDFHLPLDNRLRINTGLEYIYKNFLFFRAGYKFLGYEVDTFGIGLGTFFELGNKILKFDFSYAPVSMLGNNLIFSFTLKYASLISEEKRREIYLYYYKGIYLYINKDYHGAIKMWEKSLELDPNFKAAKEKIQDALKLLELQKIEEKIKK